MWDAEAFALIVGAYLLGSVPSAYLVARWWSGIDIRRYGSGNVGISNVYVQSGFKATVPVVLFDTIIKGAVPVIIASDKVLDLGLGVEVAVGLAAVVGHSWSVLVKFRGGRGIAAVLGVLITLNAPLPFLYGLPAFLGWRLKGDSGLWWGAATLGLPLWTLVLRLESEITYLALAFIGLTVLKRLLSNGLAGVDASGERIPWSNLLFNRLVYDRDISNRQEWISRTPDQES